MDKYEKIEFWVMILWSMCMIPLGFYAVVKGHDVPMGLASCYCGALGSYAIKVTWKKKGDDNGNAQ